ncbi:DnaJ family domain-containing protein [Desulfobacula sp.]|uniref:DnaJ family domain-containing protein n=1 Tax=Desulfobacula sp. TaxID=2593537 RepID=UPI0027149430|nr:DnaJ family domain-containing protein [Desulfobacula sp.]
MIPGFETLVEERIKKAQKDGAFDNLEGNSKPLKFEDQHIPEEFRLAHKILKNSGFLPPEVELTKKITQTEQLLEAAIIDSPERLKIQKKLNYLFVKLNTIRGDRPCSPVMADTYRNNIIKKMS